MPTGIEESVAVGITITGVVVVAVDTTNHLTNFYNSMREYRGGNQDIDLLIDAVEDLLTLCATGEELVQYYEELKLKWPDVNSSPRAKQCERRFWQNFHKAYQNVAKFLKGREHRFQGNWVKMQVGNTKLLRQLSHC